MVRDFHQHLLLHHVQLGISALKEVLFKLNATSERLIVAQGKQAVRHVQLVNFVRILDPQLMELIVQIILFVLKDHIGLKLVHQALMKPEAHAQRAQEVHIAGLKDQERIKLTLVIQALSANQGLSLHHLIRPKIFKALLLIF